MKNVKIMHFPVGRGPHHRTLVELMVAGEPVFVFGDVNADPWKILKSYLAEDHVHHEYEDTPHGRAPKAEGEGYKLLGFAMASVFPESKEVFVKNYTRDYGLMLDGSYEHMALPLPGWKLEFLR